MTTNTDPVRALIGEMTEYLDQVVDPELDVIEQWRDRLEAALSQQPAAPTLAKRQPCGCVICTCEDEQQCQGCGAKHCGNRADHPPYVVQQPAGVDEAPTWSRQQPTVPGIYGIRGFNLCRPASEQFEAVVVVREHGGELVCNLHESTSEDDLESWAPICDLDPDFEWRVFVPGWQQGGA